MTLASVLFFAVVTVAVYATAIAVFKFFEKIYRTMEK